MKRGFSLVELLIVVAIVALVGVIAIQGTNKSTASVVIGVQNPFNRGNASPYYPDATGYVMDTSGIISPETRAAIEAGCTALEPLAQVAVVTVKTTAPLTDEQYGIKLAEKLGVGHKGKDDGILLWVATEDRRIRIEVGRGAEAFMTDAKAGRILDEAVVPYLKQNKWDEGILAGFNAIKKEIESHGK
jgi:uncharacterized protein